jgi:hypothetical protein
MTVISQTAIISTTENKIVAGDTFQDQSRPGETPPGHLSEGMNYMDEERLRIITRGDKFYKWVCRKKTLMNNK